MSDIVLRHSAYEHIKGMLLTGELPRGSVLSEQSLASKIGMSRTPVREAIHQLELEGFLDKVPRSGTIVRAPDREEISELYDLRVALESYAAAEAPQNLSPADRELMGLLVEDMWDTMTTFKQSGRDFLDDKMLRRFLTADSGFHMIMIRSMNNRRFMKILADFRVMERIFGYHRMPHGPRILDEACSDHAEIMNAILAGDGELARRAITRHIRSSKAHALEAMDANGATGPMERPSLPADLRREIDLLPSVSGANAGRAPSQN